MMKNSKLKFNEYMQNISRSKSFGKFALIVCSIQNYFYFLLTVNLIITVKYLVHNEMTTIGHNFRKKVLAKNVGIKS